MHQKLTYNVTGQSFILDALQGRPSSVTSVKVFAQRTGDDGTTETATTGSPAVETSPDTTFDANSGTSSSDPRLLNLAATTGMAIGRRYLATNALAEKEWVEIVAITSAASAGARHDLRNDYASADTLEGTRMSISVLDGWIQDTNNISDDVDPNPGYRIQWIYVVAGVTHQQDTYADVVRYKAEHDVRPQDVDLIRRGWIESLPTEYREDQGRTLIDEAYEQVAIDLHLAGLADEMLRNRDVVNQLTKLMSILMQSEDDATRSGADTTAFTIDSEKYQKNLDGFIRITNKTDMSVDADGSGVPVDAVSLLEK